MKRIDAIVLPGQLEFVLQALRDHGIDDYIVSEVVGVDRAYGQTACDRSAEHRVDVRPEAKVEVFVPDEIALTMAYAIVDGAHATNCGAPRIFVSAVEEIVRPVRIHGEHASASAAVR